MISEKERAILSEILGNNYTKDVIQNLKTKNILNDKNEEYSRTSIRQVFKGKWSNTDIEIAIHEVYFAKKQKMDLLLQKRRQLLKQNS